MIKMYSVRIIIIFYSLGMLSNEVKACQKQYKRICYYSSWSGSLYNLYSKPELCTAVIYTHAKLENGIFTGLRSNPLIELKKHSQDIKLIIGVGGWSFSVREISLLLGSAASRKKFILEAVKFMRKLQFDGVDLDFKFPNTNIVDLNKPSYTVEKHLFKLLCQEMREHFELEGNGKNVLLISASIGCQKPDITGYPISEIANYLDFINLLTFDLRGVDDAIGSHHSALYPSLSEEGEQLYFNQDWVVKYLLNMGVKSDKLMLGIAFFGKSFVWSSDTKILGAPAKFREAFVSFKQVCTYLKKGWKRIWLDDQKVPFIYENNVAIGYDDLESIEIKLNYTVEHKLGGVAMWSLDLEDSNGNLCSKGEYPLLNKIHLYLSKQTSDCLSTTPRVRIGMNPKLATSLKNLNSYNNITNLNKKNLQHFQRDYLAFRNNSFRINSSFTLDILMILLILSRFYNKN